MVRISELLKKRAGEKPQTGEFLVSEAIKEKGDIDSPLGVRRIYEDTILRLKHIFQDIIDGKSVEIKEIENLAVKIEETLQVKIDTFLSLVNNFSLYEKEDDFLYAHSVNVAILVTNIGISFGFDKRELIDLCIASLIHDIGMLKVPQEIVSKPEKLTKGEFELVKKHPIYGLQLLSNVKGLPKATLEVVYHHHDKIDGTGYPEPKRGERTSKYAQIVGIAEIYEALTHPRPYRSYKIIPSEAVKIIVKEESSSYENEILRAFLNYVTFYPVGSHVLLNTNEIGKVLKVNENLPLRPVVEIMYDSERKKLEKTKTIDLTKSPVVYIEKAIDEDTI
ncbi:MAG: HD-GYP domain-containing protein [Candidatus Aminicenantaceae bacterium]